MSRLIHGEEARRVCSYLGLDRACHRGGVGIGVLAAGSGVDCSPINANNTSAPFVPTKIPGCVLWCETDTTAHPTAVVFPVVTSGDDDMEAPGVAAWPDAEGGSTSKVGLAHSGLQCLRGTAGLAGVSQPYHANIFPNIGSWTTVTGWVRGDGISGVPSVAFGGAGAINPIGTFANAWQFFSVTAQNIGDRNVYFYSSGMVPTTGYFELDDLHFTSFNVSQLTDLSGNGHHLVQPTAVKQPLWVPSGAGGVVRSNGTQFTRTDPFVLNQPTSVFVAAAWTDNLAPKRLCDGNAADSQCMYTTGLDATLRSYAGLTLVGPISAINATPRIYDALFNGVASTIAVDGGVPVVGNAGAANAGGITLQSQSGGGAAPLSDVCAMIVYDRALSTAERANLIGYLRALGARIGWVLP
jgi:hypothetical protein